MAQMPIQLHSGRAPPPAGALPAVRPPVSYPADRNDISGGISGGLLRPGAIDQTAFKAHLEAARTRAGDPPRAAFGPPVPTLTPAQLAALGVDLKSVELENADAMPAGAPAKPALDLSAGYALDPAQAAEAGAAAPPAADPAAAADAPETAPAPVAPGQVAHAAARPGPMPRARMGADGVWELPRLPDKDEREMLRGQQWRVVEDPAARALFLGPDGEFGWDDFVDLINPLQHIPLINLAYRAVTGDEIYGAARMVDFAFGPMAGVSTVVDLAFRDVTGRSMAENAVAALFGGDADEQWAGDVATAASGTQIADAAQVRRGSNR